MSLIESIHKTLQTKITFWKRDTIIETQSDIPRFHGSHLDLTSPRQSMAHKCPVDQVGGVVYSTSRKVFKRARAEVVIRLFLAVYHANGWIWVEAPNDGVLESRHWA